MNKKKISNDTTPSVYDTEKIIDIHSSESDPSFDAEKVREANSRVSHSKGLHNSNDISPINENNSDSTERIPTLVKYSDMNKDDDEFEYKGEI